MHDVDKFRQWLVEEGKATSTIQSYVTDVTYFFRFMAAKGHEPVFSRFAFVRYKQYLQAEAFAPATINKKVNSLKVWNDYLVKEGDVPETVISLKRDRVHVATGSEHVVHALSDKEVEQLLFYVEDGQKVSLRNKLIVYLLLYTGVRVTELINIERAKIDGMSHTLTITGKGGKVRELSLRSDVMALITTYQQRDRQASPFRDSPFLLVSQRTPGMHRDAVRELLARMSQDLGFHLHPHLFRRTFCTMLLKKGIDISTVSKLAGHSSLNMTAKYYIQTTRTDKQQAVDLL